MSELSFLRTLHMGGTMLARDKIRSRTTFFAPFFVVFSGVVTNCSDGRDDMPAAPATGQNADIGAGQIDTSTKSSSRSSDKSSQNEATADANDQITQVVPIDISGANPTEGAANGASLSSTTTPADDTWTQVCTAYKDICNTVKWVMSMGDKNNSQTSQTTNQNSTSTTPSTKTTSAANTSSNSQGGVVTSR